VSLDRPRWHLARIAVGYGIALAAIYFTMRRVELTTPDFLIAISSHWRWSTLVALTLFTLHTLMNAFAFGCLLRSFAPGSYMVSNAAAWGASVLAKYVPGGVWQIVGRGVLLHRQGITPRATLWSALIEQLLSLAGCVAVILLVSRITLEGTYAGAWVGGWAVLLFIFAAPASLLKCIGAVHRRPYLASAILYITALAPYAAAYALVVEPEVLGRFIQGLFEGTIAGVLALFAPGGLGIRESWVALGQPDENVKLMLASMIFARILILTSEILISLGGMAWLRRASGDISRGYGALK